jgi:hypothetical protein
MQIDEILKAIDDQILQLQQARALLATDATGESAPKGRGRPKRAVTIPAVAKPVTRRLSEEGKARIAAAQKARWAAAKKAVGKTASVKTAPAARKTSSKAAKKSGAAKKAASSTPETTSQA